MSSHAIVDFYFGGGISGDLLRCGLAAAGPDFECTFLAASRRGSDSLLLPHEHVVDSRDLELGSELCPGERMIAGTKLTELVSPNEILQGLNAHQAYLDKCKSVTCLIIVPVCVRIGSRTERFRTFRIMRTMGDGHVYAAVLVLHFVSRSGDSGLASIHFAPDLLVAESPCGPVAGDEGARENLLLFRRFSEALADTLPGAKQPPLPQLESVPMTPSDLQRYKEVFPW